ncbi:MAG: hypothetical protein H0W83_03900 [Planctomycetes bacterium]|nr:hypothetical protein [Planctomycetota bacterium]
MSARIERALARHYWKEIYGPKLMALVAAMVIGSVVASCAGFPLVSLALITLSMIAVYFTPTFPLLLVTPFERCLPITFQRLWALRLRAYLKAIIIGMLPLVAATIISYELLPYGRVLLRPQAMIAVALLIPVCPVGFVLLHRIMTEWSVIAYIVVMPLAAIGAFCLHLGLGGAALVDARMLWVAGGVGLAALALAPWACRVAGRERDQSTVVVEALRSDRGDITAQFGRWARLQTWTVSRVAGMPATTRWFAATLAAYPPFWLSLVHLLGVVLLQSRNGDLFGYRVIPAQSDDLFPYAWFIVVLFGVQLQPMIRRVAAHRAIDRTAAARLLVWPVAAGFGLIILANAIFWPAPAPGVHAWTGQTSDYYQDLGYDPATMPITGSERHAIDVVGECPTDPDTRAFFAAQLARWTYRTYGVAADPGELAIGTGPEWMVSTAPIQPALTAAYRMRLLLNMLSTALFCMVWSFALLPACRGEARRIRRWPTYAARTVVCLIPLVMAGLWGASLFQEWTMSVPANMPYPIVPIWWYHDVLAWMTREALPMSCGMAAATVAAAWLLVRQSRYVELVR